MTDPSAHRELLARMRSVIDSRGDAVAVREADRDVTYAEFEAMIFQVRRALASAPHTPGEPVGLLLDRSAVAYAAMWASLSLGRTYVPLNLAYPTARLADIIEQAGVRDVVSTSASDHVLTELHTADLGIARLRSIVADELDQPAVDRDEIWEPTAGSDLAYLLFTSGSTGRAKGVPISHGNLLAFVDAMAASIPLHPDDVCTQVCELAFDFSAHEIFLTLLAGATLCPARTIDLFNPAEYVARHRLTVWVGVPSLARIVLDGPVPVDRRLETLRLSIFNGEPLPVGLAGRWSMAAPNSVIWNTYGPTECTVAVTGQIWDDGDHLQEADIVSIGTPLPGCRVAVDDGTTVIPVAGAATERGAVASDGVLGELLLDGPQRFDGYLDDTLPSPFVVHDGTTWYRTGDRVRWRDGRLYHLGRLDHQVKIDGHRIELLEIEHRLRRTLDTDALAVIAHPKVQPVELVLFGTEIASEAITAAATGLPNYMVPRRVLNVTSLPTNTNGKLDREALHQLAGAGR